ncbi:MAG: hypothetical protein AAF368_18665 [Planctomycetota bacterium]
MLRAVQERTSRDERIPSTGTNPLKDLLSGDRPNGLDPVVESDHCERQRSVVLSLEEMSERSLSNTAIVMKGRESNDPKGPRRWLGDLFCPSERRPAVSYTVGPAFLAHAKIERGESPDSSAQEDSDSSFGGSFSDLTRFGRYEEGGKPRNCRGRLACSDLIEALP